jgi:hypothetical protein
MNINTITPATIRIAFPVLSIDLPRISGIP